MTARPTSLDALREEASVVVCGPGEALVGTYACHDPAPAREPATVAARRQPRNDDKYRAWLRRKMAATRLTRDGRHGIVFAMAASGEASDAIGRLVGESADAVEFLLAKLDESIERSWTRWLACYQPGVTTAAMRAVAAADAERARTGPPARHTITVVLTTGDRATATVASKLCDEGTALGLELAASTIRARMARNARRRTT